VQEQALAAAFPHRTPIRLGMKARIGGTEYEAIGRQVMRQHEEGQVYTWEEWVLASAEGHMLFLEYDEGKWKQSEPFIPEEPVGPEELMSAVPGRLLRLDGRSAMVSDAGVYEVAFAEGEFPWLVLPGKRVAFRDATSGNRVYCVEWTEDEIEYFRGGFLDERQVYAAFGMREALTALARRELVNSSRRYFGAACLLAGALALVLWMMALGSGRTVANGNGTVQAVARPAAAGEDPGTRFGPIRLTAVNRVHRLEIRGRMQQQSAWVQAVLEDEGEQELMAVDREMWDESGYDSDGAWHESDLHAQAQFVLRKTGNYYIRIYAEPEPGTTSTPIQASFEVKERTFFTPYLGWFSILSLLVGGAFLVAGSPHVVAAAKQGMEPSQDPGAQV